MKDGKKTSEFKVAWLMPLLNVLIMLGGALASAYSDSTVGLIAAAIVAALNSVVGSSYIKSRGIVKVADTVNKANP